MVTFITEIIEKFGGRPAGTAAEKGAQEYTRSVLEKYCHSTTLEAFQSHLTSHFGILKPLSLVYIFVLVLYWFAPVAAIIVGLLNTIVFFIQFLTYRHWFDFLYPNQESWNVEGVIEPEGEVKSTLLVAGHIDSVYEFKWWYKLGSLGGILTVVAGFVLSLQFAGLAVAYYSGNETLAAIIWWAQVALAPTLIVLFDMHNKSLKVDGALDNLTGVALAVEMAKIFSQKRLQHTRLRLVSFGAEEPCLRGAAAYAKQHYDRLRAENAVLINIDTIKEKKHLSIATSELNTMVRYPQELVEKMEASFKALQVPVKKVTIGVGGTDGAAFRFRGLPALTLIGLDSSNFDPCYHTRLDNLSHLNPDGLEAMRDVLVHFIVAWDGETAS
jgi:hypothetical protein